MTKTFKFAAVALGALTIAACGSNTGSTEGQAIRAVGSSTVYPFATVVSETFARNYPDYPSPLIESTGTGGGMALFCEGAGADTPSLANASRRMKLSEFETCQANDVTGITELQVGLDGIAFAAAQGGIDMNLTPEIVYRALAANPYGEEQTAENWSDIDPSLPNLPILVYGPPSTSGTRDALKELVLEVGCKAGTLPEGLSEEQEDQICTEVRSDGAFVDQGEQDNLIVQKIESNPNAVGVFGYSYLEENADRVNGLSVNGVEPTYENISSFAYPGARPLFVYVKNDHVGAIPGLAEFLGTWAESWGVGGPLAQIGLVASPEDVMARNNAAVTELPALTAADFE
ncbi:substrate-binding domain-containing protein [Alteraurantiacibacter aquimixticola]|uniref:Phosphate ABC transporter substrate-binding protein n=1 Tax=Alteraurantiacibacter aquimixticola TaxID=2489173 RepID=A0A4T3F5R7_9SPHN|nr:substrate-binding domain-containing protein [Alteraurantiacibacter aquimixticola]TIX50186.1 phosphate ABC transporter substrate-binding protein [Alteraurantiacibacter aquimixticola]